MARDKYLVTSKSLAHLKKSGFLKDSGLRRGLKSRKNGFTYEYPIPANVIGDKILMHHSNQGRIQEMLRRTDCIFVLTTQENERLKKNLVHSMPFNWRFFKDDVLARYFEVGITKPSVIHTEIAVSGLVKR